VLSVTRRGPGFAALQGPALGDPPVERKQDSPAGGRANWIPPLAESSLDI
jgi:hypothetical protein